MNESELEEALRRAAQQPGPPLPGDFQFRVWSKIAREKAAPSRTGWLNRFLGLLVRPQGALAALAAVMVVGWTAGRLSTELWTHASGADAGSGKLAELTGEVIDLACYYDDGGSGPGHVECAKRCIASGLPVGIKTADGKTYLLVGDVANGGMMPGPKHNTLNQELAQYAAQTVTVRGRLVEKNGMSVLENTRLLPGRSAGS